MTMTAGAESANIVRKMACLKNVMVLGLCDELTLNLSVAIPLRVGEVKERVRQRTCVDATLFTLSRGGVILDDSDIVGECDVTVLHAHYRLRGGKGGFGSLIRAMGSQINKSTNKEACRNLTGRRVRDINAEKKLAKWAADEPERKRKEAEEKRRRLERKRAGPKHTFDDTCYMEQIKSTEEEMGGALKQGLEASASGSGKGKSKAVETDRPYKRPKIWLGVEEELSDSEDEGEQTLDRSQDLEHTLEEEDSSSDKTERDGDLAEPSTSHSNNSDSNDTEPCSSSSIAGNVADSAQAGNVADSAQTIPKSSSNNDQEHPPNAGEEKSSLDNEPVDLSKYESAEELVSVGGERLKHALQSLGLKCGGTPLQRAQRLFLTKGKTKEQFDPSLFAKSKKTKCKDK